MPDQAETVSLPAEWVEAAAKGRYSVEHPGGDWECEGLADLLIWREEAHAALAAVVPLIRADLADKVAKIPRRDQARVHVALEHAERVVRAGVTDA